MKYINRKEVFKDQTFATFISGWQKTRYPSEIAERKEGEYYDEKTDSLRFYSQNELDNILDKEIAEYKKITDDIKEVDVEMTCTIVIDSPSDQDEIIFLTEVMASLMKENNIEFTFIPLFNLSWFHEKNSGEHPSTKTAYSNFKKFIGNENYSGGVIVSDYFELKKMLPDYFNLIQSNYYGYNFFYSETLKTICSFHYSGQIWFYIYSEESMKKIKSFINQNNLIINDAYTTYNKV
jgi:hypothetical protein